MKSFFEGTHFSWTLGTDMNFTVILPSNMPESGKFPLLYLLHGLGGNHKSWLTLSNITRYADNAGLAVAMPTAERSFYCDTASDRRYYTYITDEFSSFIRKVFPVTDDPKETYIAGLSMGGYGALKIALRNPQSYSAVGCFSGCVDLRSMLENEHPLSEAECTAIFGRTLSGEDDILLLTAKAAREKTVLPSLYITCGLSDPLYEQNRRLRSQLDFLRIPYVYDEWPGDHEWNFWDCSIRHFIQFLGK